jgi:glycosidase
MIAAPPLTRPLSLILAAALLAGCAGGQAAAPTPSPAAAAGAPSTPTPAAPGAPAASPGPEQAPAAAPSPIPAAPTAAALPGFPLQAGWWDDAVCYEVFVRSFADSDGDGVGDLNGLIGRLDYINDGDPATQNDLGATCIWLMPIAEATSYHGYDVTDYYAVERDYGTNEDFKRLVAEAHRRGVKVILDLVLNHTSVEHPWFQEALRDPASPYRDWYIFSPTDPGYPSPWGEPAWHRSPAADEYYYGIFWSGMPDLNYRNPAVTAEAERISAFWLNELGADGFRLDAIKHLIEDGPVQEHTPETHAWLRGYRQFLERQAPGAFTVGEIFDATPKILQPYLPDQLDSYFIFDLSDRIVDAARSGNARPFVSAVGRVSEQLPYQRFAPFLTNHDQDRVMGLLGGDPARMKLAATALLTIPGLPFVYYGEEIGVTGAKPDENLRTPMQWSAEPNAGFSANTPWRAPQPNYAEVNVAAQAADRDSLLSHYRRLIHLHAAEPALSRGDFTPLDAEARQLAAYVRQAGDEAVLVLINFGQDPLDAAALSLASSGLAPGSYRLAPLLDDTPAADLIVADGGAVQGYVPLSSIPPRTSLIYKLTRAP